MCIQYHKLPRISIQQARLSSWFIFQSLIQKENLFFVFSIAVSMSVLAGLSGGLIAASYSTFCAFGDLWSRFMADWLFYMPCTYRWTQTCLFMCFTCPCNWFGWRCYRTKHSFSLVLEVFLVHGWFAWLGPWCKCHWRYIPAWREGKSYGIFLCRKSTSKSYLWSDILISLD